MPFKIPILQASGEKRSADGVNSSQPAKKSKLPPLGELVESAPKRANAQRLPAVAPLNICIYKARRPLSLSVVVVGWGCRRVV